MKIKILMLLCALLFIQAVNAQSSLHYTVSLDYRKGNISISSVKLEYIPEVMEEDFGFHVVKLIDTKDRVLYERFFMVPNVFIYDITNGSEISGGSMDTLDEVSFDLSIPYNKEAKDIVIYDDEGNELARQDVTEYSDELVYKSVSKEKAAEEKLEEETIDYEERRERVDKSNIYIWILAVVLVALLVILFYLILRKKEQET